MPPEGPAIDNGTFNIHPWARQATSPKNMLAVTDALVAGTKPNAFVYDFWPNENGSPEGW